LEQETQVFMFTQKTIIVVSINEVSLLAKTKPFFLA